ncbi:unnamed protein product [Colias eurytheme]|nr:unnamed protein product [Colias eurytheme]
MLSLIWLVAELPYGPQPIHPRQFPLLHRGRARAGTGSECKSVGHKSIAVATCIPSRCARENCVRCACTALTELTEGRQRTLAAPRPPRTPPPPPLSSGLAGPPQVTLSRSTTARIAGALTFATVPTSKPVSSATRALLTFPSKLPHRRYS